jgi:mono/diheme cytochrome c family protein
MRAGAGRRRWRGGPARHRAIALIAAAVGFFSVSAARAASPSPEEIARGKYVFGATGGCGCHTKPKDQVNSGGRRYDVPFGTVYSSNITPDKESGIGNWTDDQLVTAIRLGRRPNGERMTPVHPYLEFNAMTDEDTRAVIAFLRTLPPVKRTPPANQFKVPLFGSVFLPAWLATFATFEKPRANEPMSGIARGEYLVRVLGHCGECHTPRTTTMASDNSRFLAGDPKGPENAKIPNITPDKDTGLTWTVEQIADFLGTGNKPDGDVVGGLMGEVIEGTAAGYKDLTQADRVAIAQYLKSIPAVKNKIGK